MTSSREGADVERYMAMASGPFWMVFAGKATCGLSLSLPIYKSKKEWTISRRRDRTKKTRGITTQATHKEVAQMVCVKSVEFNFTVDFSIVAVDQQDPDVIE